MAETEGEIVAFGDANVLWAADALRRLVRPFADPAVGMACGDVRLVNPGGAPTRRGSTGATRCGCARASREPTR